MKTSKKLLSILLVVVFSFSCFFASFGATIVYAQTDVLQVHFLDVGQGDCSIIKLPDDKTILVDAGDNINKYKQKIIDYIDSNFPQLDYFDYAILTHTDADHSGGMKEVLTNYPAKTVYRPNVISSYSGFTDPVIAITQNISITDDNLKLWDYNGPNIDVKKVATAVYKNFVQQAYQPFVINNSTYTPEVIVSDGRIKDRPDNKPSQDIIGEDYSIIFYSPLRYTYSDVNDYSNIFILSFQGFEFFFSGDAEAQAEADFVEEYADYDFDIDVFKLGHHGSRTSSSQALLELVTRQEKRENIKLVASCGLDNKYGHPHQDTLDRLNTLGFLEENILRTDTMGDIVFEVKADSTGSYSLYYNGNKISDDFIQELFNAIQEFFVTFYQESPQGVYLSIAVIIILAIIVGILITKSNKKSKK